MMRRKSGQFILSAALMSFVLASSLSFASSNTGITYQGRITNPDGTSFQQPSVQFLIQINGSSTLHGDGTAGADTCLLYQETQTLDMSTSNGAFSLIIGQGSSPQFGSGVSSLVTVFRNPQTNAPTVADAIGAISCTSGQTNFLPSTWDDNRSLTVTVTAGSTVLNLAAVPIQSVPYSHQALQVGGYGSDSLMRVQGSRPGATNNFSLNQFDFLLNLGINAVTPGNPSTYQATNLLANDPTTAQQVATKHYVDTAVSAATAPLSTSGATSGQVLQYNGSAWVPTTPTTYQSSTLNDAKIWVGNSSNVATGVSVTGDASIIDTGALTVTGLQGKAVSSTAPTSNQVLQYNGSSWVPSTLTIPATLWTQNVAADALVSTGGVVVGEGKGNSSVNLWLTTNWNGNDPAINNTGTYNFGAGPGALASNTSGSDNTSLGSMSTIYNTTGNGNTAVGAFALEGKNAGTNTGSNNTAIGYNALIGNASGTAGSNNIAIGYNAGSALTTGNYNVIIGSDSGTSIAASSNYILLADGQGNRRMTIDNNGNVGIGTASPQALLDVKGHVGNSDSSTPTVATSCGVSVSLTGNDTRGTITLATATNNCTVTLTFANAFTSAPYCIVAPVTAGQYSSNTVGINSVSTASLVVDMLGLITGGRPAGGPIASFNYICMQ